MNGIKLSKMSYPHYPQASANVLQKSTSQIRLQALYYLLVRRGFAERFYQARNGRATLRDCLTIFICVKIADEC